MVTFLGIDLGTQGLKAALVDPESGRVAHATRTIASLPGLPTGHHEQDPAAWLDALRGALTVLRLSAPEAIARVAALAVSGHQHGLVVLDDAFRVVRPTMLWNDVRCSAESAAIVAAVGGSRAMFELTGLASLPPGLTAGKLRWLWLHEPAAFARVRSVMLPHDYLNWWLTGERAMEAGDASGTGWLDVRRRRFSDSICTATAPRTAELIPTGLITPGAPIGRLRPECSAALGLPLDILVSHGGGDNMMAAVGAGAVRRGVAVLSLGTSGTIFAHADQPICDPIGEIAPFCGSTGGWLPLGCTMNATVATEALRGLFGRSLESFEACVRSAPAGADGVLCVPFFTGERSPDLPAATGCLLGLTPRNLDSANLMRAAMEGATFALVRLLDRLAELGVPIDEVRLTGGGSQSPTWCSIIASCVPHHRVRAGVDPDAAALGAAIHALWTWRRANHEPELDAASCRASIPVDAQLIDLPTDPASNEIYRERRVAWQAALDALTPTFGVLTR